MAEIPFEGGPFDGQSATFGEAAPASLLTEGPDVPEGMVARYRFRPGRGKRPSAYVFKGWDRVALRVPSTQPRQEWTA